MNKYLKYYYIDTFLTIALVLLNYFFDLDQVNYYEYYGSGVLYVIPTVLAVISFITIVLNIAFHSCKYEFDENNLLFPKYYLIFLILILLLGIIYEQFTFISGVHIMYYLSFIICGYAMLSTYTLFSFKNNNKNKEKSKTNKRIKKNK